MKELQDKAKENERYQAELLSMIINNSDVYIKSIDFLRPALFTGTNRILFEAYERMIKDSQEVDAASLSTVSNIPFEDVLKVSMYYSGVPLKIDALIYELFDYMAKFKLTQMGMNISQQVTAGTKYEHIVDIVTSTLRALELGNSSSVITMEKGVESLRELINSNRSDKPFTGTPVGFKLVDHHMGGLHPGNLIILAGETSHGKTAFALSMMYNSAVYYNEPSGIISHEMTSDELMARFAAYTTNINAKHILTGKLSDDQVVTFNNRITKLIDRNIFIQDFIKRELHDNISAIRLLVMQHKVKYVVVENAGNIQVKGSYSDETRTAEISKSFKSLALELGITIILISHLNRDEKGKKAQPELSRLRHSGQLEADADVVMFVYMAKLHGFDNFPEDADIPAEGRIKTYIAKGRSYGLAKTYPDFIKELVLVRDHEENVRESYNANLPPF